MNAEILIFLRLLTLQICNSSKIMQILTTNWKNKIFYKQDFRGFELQENVECGNLRLVVT